MYRNPHVESLVQQYNQERAAAERRRNAAITQPLPDMTETQELPDPSKLQEKQQ